MRTVEDAYSKLREGYQPSFYPAGIPYTDWPFWAKSLSKFATPEDKGIGDVTERTIGKENSAAFKFWFKATFNKDCGCTGRQREWNAKFPLPVEVTHPA
jgi:hypothetical protein